MSKTHFISKPLTEIDTSLQNGKFEVLIITVDICLKLFHISGILQNRLNLYLEAMSKTSFCFMGDYILIKWRFSPVWKGNLRHPLFSYGNINFLYISSKISDYTLNSVLLHLFSKSQKWSPCTQIIMGMRIVTEWKKDQELVIQKPVPSFNIII